MPPNLTISIWEAAGEGRKVGVRPFTDRLDTQNTRVQSARIHGCKQPSLSWLAKARALEGCSHPVAAGLMALLQHPGLKNGNVPWIVLELLPYLPLGSFPW